MAACEGCTCGRANGGGTQTSNLDVDGNQVAATNGGASVPLSRALQKSFTSPPDDGNEGVPGKVPYRSKRWFNDPHDPGESSGCHASLGIPSAGPTTSTPVNCCRHTEIALNLSHDSSPLLLSFHDTICHPMFMAR